MGGAAVVAVAVAARRAMCMCQKQQRKTDPKSSCCTLVEKCVFHRSSIA